METPKWVRPGDEYHIVGHVFGTPVVVKGWTWLPLFELIIWGVVTWVFGLFQPQRTLKDRLKVAALATPIVVASEWLHNFAHAAAAYFVGKPMDFLRITWGTPLLVYQDVNDPTVSPRQHIWRAMGGPLINLLLLPIMGLWRAATRPGTLARDIANAGLLTNLLIPLFGILPLPALDGGPLLKWSVIARTGDPENAEKVVRVANGIGAGIFAAAAVFTLGRRKWVLSSLLLQFFGLMLSYALGWLKE